MALVAGSQTRANVLCLHPHLQMILWLVISLIQTPAHFPSHPNGQRFRTRSDRLQVEVSPIMSQPPFSAVDVHRLLLLFLEENGCGGCRHVLYLSSTSVLLEEIVLLTCIS